MNCVLKSFCFAADVEEEELLGYLGHNGRGVINPELPEPYCYRAFDVHEISRVLFDFGFGVTPILKYDTVYNSMMQIPKYLVENGDRVQPYLDFYSYCLSNHNHMIGFRNGVVLDTTGKITDPKSFDYQCIYLITKRYNY